MVMVTGVLITAYRVGNFSPINMLRGPMRYGGDVVDGRLQLAVPNGFPVMDSVIKTDNTRIEVVARHFPGGIKRQPTEQNSEIAIIDFRPLPIDQIPNEGSLEYYPLYRFLSEQHMFNAEGRVAEYAADCTRFMLQREGYTPFVFKEGDVCRVATGDQTELLFRGMSSLQQIIIQEPENKGAGKTVIELDRYRLRVSRYMFPEIYEAGEKVVKSGDALAGLSISCTDNHVVFEAQGVE